MASDAATFPIVRTDARYLIGFARGVRWGLGLIGAISTFIGFLVVGLHWSLLFFLLPWFVLPLVRGGPPEPSQELRIDDRGIFLTENKKTREWLWGEISGVHKVYITRNRLSIVNLEIKRKASLMPHEPGHYDIEPMDFGFSTDELASIIGEGVKRWGGTAEVGESPAAAQ